MVFVLMSLMTTNTYAESAKVVVIPLGADSLPAGTLSGTEIVTGTVIEISAGHTHANAVSCPAGKVVLGGGLAGTSSGGSPYSIGKELQMIMSYPSSTTQWSVTVKNTSSSGTYIKLYAVCATVN